MVKGLTPLELHGRFLGKDYLKLVQEHRSPRWSSGYPRMLLLLIKLVLGFESHVGTVVFLSLFAKRNERNQLTAESV